MRNRAESIPADMRTLRREFSTGNWRDLEGQETRVIKLILAIAEPLARFEDALAAQRWDESLGALDETETALARSDHAIDARRDRLRTLGEFRVDPKSRLNKARFAIRDAQMLVMRSAEGALAPYAGQLDALVRRVEKTEPELVGVHPDYWSVITELDSVQQAVKELVGRYRAKSR
jgi:hypothetical protein